MSEDEEVQTDEVQLEEAQISARELRAARARMGISQQELAQRLQHSLRTITDWERDGVPNFKVARIRAELGSNLVLPGGRPLVEAASDMALLSEIMALLSEIMRRLAARGAED
jgi:DNA-binding XRE family transcriptional regulator